MLKPRVHGPRINKVGQPQLLDPPEALEKRMLNKFIDNIIIDVDESIYGIVDDFFLVHKEWFLVKFFLFRIWRITKTAACSGKVIFEIRYKPQQK